MKLKTVFITALLLFFAFAIIAFPDRYISTCFEGFCIWAESVLPSLFPFMVICGILIKTGVADAAARPLSKCCGKAKLPGAAFPLLLMSVCSGYPAGSRMLSEYRLSGLVNDSDCKKLAPLCSTAGPLFITGTVGFKAFGSGGAGIKLLCACLISVISTSLIYSLLSKPDKQAATSLTALKKQSDVLYDSFYGAFIAVCMAGGFIAFFFTLSHVLADFNILSPLAYALSPLFGKEGAFAVLCGLCEATGGCFALARAGGFFALPLAGFLITFGGASIIAQQMCYLGKCNVKTGYFIVFKFVQGVISFALLCLFSLW